MTVPNCRRQDVEPGSLQIRQAAPSMGDEQVGDPIHMSWLKYKILGPNDEWHGQQLNSRQYQKAVLTVLRIEGTSHPR